MDKDYPLGGEPTGALRSCQRDFERRHEGSFAGKELAAGGPLLVTFRRCCCFIFALHLTSIFLFENDWMSEYSNSIATSKFPSQNFPPRATYDRDKSHDFAP